MRKSLLFLIPFLAVTAVSAQPAPSIEGIMGSSPISCIYMMLHAYREELNVCHQPLDEAREERFSRMKAAMEDYVFRNARLDPEGILINARGAAERVTQAAPVCGSGEYEEIRQAMLNFTTAESERLLDEQLATNALRANGSCY